MIGRRVYIEELGQLGTVEEMTPDGKKVKTVRVQTPDGPKLVDILEKGYKILTMAMALLKLILSFFGK
jgi:hypothetical protein